MKTLPTQERALRKRSALITAAIADFSEVGFEVATAKSIAASAGVATGTFYQYFENKNDILCVIAQERVALLQKKIQLLELQSIDAAGVESTVEKLFERILTFVFDFHLNSPELHQVLEQRRALDTKLRTILNDGEAVLQERVLAFVQSFNLSESEIVAENLFAMAEGLVHRQVYESLGHDPQLVLRMGAKMLAAYFNSYRMHTEKL